MTPAARISRLLATVGPVEVLAAIDGVTRPYGWSLAAHIARLEQAAGHRWLP